MPYMRHQIGLTGRLGGDAFYERLQAAELIYWIVYVNDPSTTRVLRASKRMSLIMSLRGAQRRSNLNPRHGRLLRFARKDIPAVLSSNFAFALQSCPLPVDNWGPAQYYLRSE